MLDLDICFVLSSLVNVIIILVVICTCTYNWKKKKVVEAHGRCNPTQRKLNKTLVLRAGYSSNLSLPSLSILSLASLVGLARIYCFPLVPIPCVFGDDDRL